MSREEQELSEQAFYDGLLPRGSGDPDAYGYPGEPINEGDIDGTSTPQTNPTVVPF